MTVRRSIPASQFPRKFQLALKQFETARRGRRRYSKASIQSTSYAFGQYLALLQRVGLPLQISHEGLSAFIDDLDARKLRGSTKLSYMAGIQAMAKEVKYPSSERRLILEDCEIYREEMMREVPLKVRKLAANPITLLSIATAAAKWRKEAFQSKEPNKRLTYFQRSAILAFLSLTPIRINDVTKLVLGEHIERHDTGWIITFSSSKSGYRHTGQLHHSLTPYLDDLLLYGKGGSALCQYAKRKNTPLFATEANEFLSSRTLAYNFKIATGHTPHIVRTLVHDAMAEHGSHGSELARVLCGQTSIQIAKRYEVHAERFRAQKAQDILAQIHLNQHPM